MSKTLIEKQVKTRVKGEARKKVQQPAKLNKKGEEVLDPQPLFHDLGFKQPESMNDKIRRVTQQVQADTLAKLAAQNMSEEDIQRVLDEEDDFEIPEDYSNTMTIYEAQGMLADLDDTVSLSFADPSVVDAPVVEDNDTPSDAPIQTDIEDVIKEQAKPTKAG